MDASPPERVLKIVLLLRHGAAGQVDAGTADRDRDLDPRGQAEAAGVATLLETDGPRPDLIVCSPARRASATAALVADRLAPAVPVETDERLYLASPETCLAVLQTCSDRAESVLLVAHNPGLEQLVTVLTGETMAFATGRLVRIDLPISSWQELSDATRGIVVRL